MSTQTKILLTGAAGLLGTSIRQTADDSVEIVGVDIQPGEDASIHEGSFADAARMRELMQGCHAVIHTAALHGACAETHTPAQFAEVNVGGLVTLLELCVELNVRRFVFSSTMEVLLGRTWDTAGLSVVDETSPAHPDWIYPLTKLQGEIAGRYYYERFDIEFVGLRYMYFYSEEPEINYMSRTLATSDVARANLLAASRQGLGYEVLNIGPDTPLTDLDIIDAIGDPHAVVDKYWAGAGAMLKERGDDIPFKRFWPVTRIDRAKHILGWQPQLTVADYFRAEGWQG